MYVCMYVCVVHSVRAQLQSIWELVQRRAVWKPCAFIFIYNMCILTNPALTSFLGHTYIQYIHTYSDFYNDNAM